MKTERFQEKHQNLRHIGRIGYVYLDKVLGTYGTPRILACRAHRALPSYLPRSEVSASFSIL